MVYLTGDTHGDFRRIKQFCFKVTPTLDDILSNLWGAEQTRQCGAATAAKKGQASRFWGLKRLVK